MTEILQNVQVFARRRLRRRQSYDNTSSFSSKTAELKITREKNIYKIFFWACTALLTPSVCGKNITKYLMT